MPLDQIVLDFRTKLNKTQEVLGKEMNVNPRMVTRLEAGWNPSQNALLRLSEIAKKYSLHEYAHYFLAAREKMLRPVTQEPPKENPPVSMDDLRLWEGKLSDSFWKMSSILDRQRGKMDGWALAVLGEYLGDIDDVRSRIRCFTEAPSQSALVDTELFASQVLAPEKIPADKTRGRNFSRAYERQMAAVAKKMRKPRKPRKPQISET